ncbi:uncharacterized protein LOC129235577 [Anastrepha obliqua]|uniref:uncharacterized protein LOC129235577 n=1 Tax=Anastrepha obliqua TaxID=95512 RepID=UPI002409F2FF|nr:uncharacterized protein LOC129235577 [Anastrepha obliqua]
MRGFIVLCLIAVACADIQGYNYYPKEHSNADSSRGLGGPGGRNDLAGDNGAATSDSPSYSAPATEFDKVFYTYTANEEDFNEPAGSEQIAKSLKKNLRVVLIKGPETNGLENAALNIARQAAEQKTAIYVLQKQADLSDLANKLQAQHDVQSHTPEVHFVKYRTAEDAINAHRAIQSQYDQLGGNSQSHDGGSAPVHNFASQATFQAPRTISSPSASYLPSSIVQA